MFHVSDLFFMLRNMLFSGLVTCFSLYGHLDEYLLFFSSSSFPKGLFMSL